MSVRVIPTDERFGRGLLEQISRTQHGSMHLEIEQGQLRWIGCHGHRALSSRDDAQELAA